MDLCPPQERARRKVSARVFLNKQARDRKKAAKEKAQADAKEVTGDGTASFGGQSQSRYLKPDTLQTMRKSPVTCPTMATQYE